MCLVEVMLERSVWRRKGGAVPSRARPWIAVEAAQRRGSVAGAGGARTSRSSVKTSVHVSTKAEAGAAVVIRPGRKGRWKAASHAISDLGTLDTAISPFRVGTPKIGVQYTKAPLIRIMQA